MLQPGQEAVQSPSNRLPGLGPGWPLDIAAAVRGPTTGLHDGFSPDGLLLVTAVVGDWHPTVATAVGIRLSDLRRPGSQATSGATLSCLPSAPVLEVWGFRPPAIARAVRDLTRTIAATARSRPAALAMVRASEGPTRHCHGRGRGQAHQRSGHHGHCGLHWPGGQGVRSLAVVHAVEGSSPGNCGHCPGVGHRSSQRLKIGSVSLRPWPGAVLGRCEG